MRFAALLTIALLVLQPAFVAHGDPLLTFPLKIKGHNVRVELANDPQSRRTGLMFRESLPENQGMLFVYENEDLHAMWMKNTFIPLSVAFIDRAGKIINIEEMAARTETTHAAAKPAAFSLEMNQGWFKRNGIKPGDRVEGLQKLPPSED